MTCDKIFVALQLLVICSSIAHKNYTERSRTLHNMLYTPNTSSKHRVPSDEHDDSVSPYEENVRVLVHTFVLEVELCVESDGSSLYQLSLVVTIVHVLTPFVYLWGIHVKFDKSIEVKMS